MMEYTDKVMENFQNPKNVGEMEDANGIGQEMCIRDSGR